MKTTKSLMSALFAGILTAMLAIPSESFGQTHHTTSSGADIYFAVGPAYNAANYSAFLTSMVNGMTNPSLSTIPLIMPGTTISATNAFMFPGDVAGHDLIAGANIWNSTPFTINDLMWILSSPAFSFTNVFSTGISFGPGLIGANGNTLYTSGNASGVSLTELWITPEDYSFQLNTGETIDQGLADLDALFGSSFPVTLTYNLNGNYGSAGTIILQTPEPSISTHLTLSANSGTLQITWPTNYFGWYLQAQTNSLTAGLGTNWVTVPGSNATNQMFIAIVPTNSSVFFRLKSSP